MATPSIVQSGTATEVLGLTYSVALAGGTPTPGNTLVAYHWRWNDTSGTAGLTPGTWTQQAAGYGYDATQYGGPGLPARLVVYTRLAGTESGTVTVDPYSNASTRTLLVEVANASYPPTVSSGTATLTATSGGTSFGTVTTGSMLLTGWALQRTAYAPADSVNALAGNTEIIDTSTTTTGFHAWVGYGTTTGAGTITVGGTPAANANLNKWGQFRADLLFTGTGPAPAAQFTADVTTGNAPLTVQFTDQSSNSPTSWAWTFGDSTSGTAQHPSHTYAAGTYTVTLVATNGSGSGTAIRTDYILAVEPEPGAFLDTQDLSGDIVSWRITRGASPEITGGAAVGQATLLLKNHVDDRYNPENEAGPLVDLLRDGTPIWIGVNNDGRLSGTAVRGLFGGYITDVTPLPQAGYTYPPFVELNAEDALGRLSRTRVTLPMSRTRSHGALRAEILTGAGVGTAYRDLGHEIETMPLSGADGPALRALEDVNKATGSRHFVAPGDSALDWYTYTVRDRQWNISGTAQGTLAGTQHVQSVSGWRRSADTVINQQRVSFTPVVFTPAQVQVWQAETLPFTLATSEVTFWVQFDDYVDGPSVDLTYSGSTVTTSLTSFGDTAQLVVSSAGTATVNNLTIEGALARRAPQESALADNAVSQSDSRGVRSGSQISNDYVGVLASARGLAEHVVWRYGDPQVRPTLTVANWFPYQFDLDLFDLISFSSTQLGVSGRLFEIVGLTHEGIHAGADAIEHRTTYVLQECRVQSTTNWFTADVHAADGSASLGY